MYTFIISRNINNALQEKPTIIDPSSGQINEEYTYIASTIEPDEEQVYYLFD